MQISIDNVEPDEVSKKSLKVLDKKLQMLAEHAEFHVNINSVVGGGFKDPNDALVIGKRALELGFESTIGIIHDGERAAEAAEGGRGAGLLRDDEPEEDQLRAVRQVSGGDCAGAAERLALPRGVALPVYLRGRAGALLLQQRGYPGVPLAEYTTADVKREFLTAKSCAPNCTIGCVHRISHIDHWRAPQTQTVSPGGQGELVKIQL